MAKVTVYVTDEQLERLKSARGVGGKGGMSKAFQAFLEQVIGGGGAPAGRYDYARKLMPVSAAIDRHRRALGRKVAEGGPPADGGPVAAALTVLLYRELLKRDPELEAALEKEFLRFGLDELVASETADVDLLAEPDPEEDVEIDESDRGPAAGPFGINLGEELRGVTEAIRTADAIRENIMGGRSRHRGGPVPPMPPRPPRPPRSGSSSRRVEIRISPSDDPREVLTVTEFERFSKRHDDWTPGSDLTPSQIESVVDFVRERVNRELDAEDDE